MKDNKLVSLRAAASRGLLFGVFGILLVVVVVLAGLGFRRSSLPRNARDTIRPAQVAASPIQHVIIIMQENRSFDTYFGTFPGADGIPPGVCAPNPNGACIAPFYNSKLTNKGSSHRHNDAVKDIDGGKMDGFVRDSVGQPDVMGYHDARDIPNYWTYAQDFTLQDHMFEPVESWSPFAHMYLVSNWAAFCARADDPGSCRSSLDVVSPIHAWTDITYLLHKSGVTWAYYVTPGTQPDTDNGGPGVSPIVQNSGTPTNWNPLASFTTVKEDGELSNIQDVKNFTTAATNGTLPNVCWVIPDQTHSEHPPANIATGQTYVTKLINAVMAGPDWNSCAIFLAWDDWGGFYDHEPPPVVDGSGYGLRVPGLVISPYAKAGFIDHQVLSFDAYNKFIEDNFLSSQRLDPSNDGRWDPRPTVRENVSILGDLMNDFDFSQAPLSPITLKGKPAPGPPSNPPGNNGSIVRSKPGAGSAALVRSASAAKERNGGNR